MTIQHCQRREFGAAIAAGVAAVTGLTAGTELQAQVLQAGKDFVKLERVIPPSKPGKIEVAMFFGYWCPHCYKLDPQLEMWAKKLPKDVSFSRIPVYFGAQTETYQKLYYALEGLNLLGSLHAKVFNTIHVEKKNLSTDSAVIAWAVAQGIDKNKFSEMYNSFTVINKAKRAAQLTALAQIESIPTMMVGGQFMVSNSTQVLQVVDALIKQQRSKK